MNVLMRLRTSESRRSTSTEMKKPKATYQMVVLGFFFDNLAWFLPRNCPICRFQITLQISAVSPKDFYVGDSA